MVPSPITYDIPFPQNEIPEDVIISRAMSPFAILLWPSLVYYYYYKDLLDCGDSEAAEAALTMGHIL